MNFLNCWSITSEENAIGLLLIMILNGGERDDSLEADIEAERQTAFRAGNVV